MSGVGSLGPAHKGYLYQDQATSHFFALSLLDHFDETVVDRKAVDDDRFDDLSVRHNSREIRRQFKSSDDPARSFDPADLLTKRHKARIDDLVRSYQRAGTAAAAEYRLCATWLTPTDAELLKLIEPIAADPSFPGHQTKMFRLRGDLIWPAGEPPVWRPLREAADITRQDFLDFAERFVIEMECPAASRDFFKPGPLESLVLNLLSESIGIGRYPHQNRSAVDVAAVLQQYAARARAGGSTVRPADVERELQLHKDFGRVEQEFPILPSAVVKRAPLRRELTQRLGAEYVILEGPPGSGKSWELTGLAEDLSNDGYLVARHYCYLEPGDPQVQRRITTNAMFANLIYDLVQANPELGKLHRPAYSAGRRELEDLVRKGIEQGIIKRAALLVDGVDHISRVFADSMGVARNEIDIVEELAALDLPAGVSLIIGTQPGVHLDPLRDRAEFVDMPGWRFGEIANLANRLRVPAQLHSAGLSGEIVKQFLVELHQRSEGNPLYATFLCRFTLEQMARGTTLDPVGGLRNAPLTGGDISVYYGHLLKSAAAGGATELIAELLGSIDFGVTEQELKEILPAWAHHVDTAVSHLVPVLAPARSQGGVRIYHESFRRFIKEWLRDRGGSASDVLAPVIAWLKRRDFFNDSRTYRFLLPTLRRAGRYRELLNMVGVDFVSRSVEAGHPRAAVEQNLSLATYTAAEELAWADLMRCVELHKSCTVCFQDKLTDYDLYGRAFAAVHGAGKLAERMVFDGRPTFSTRQGLIFCSLCDDAGVVPPWAQYLAHTGNDDDDRRREDEDWVDDALAEFHGLIRLEGVAAIYDRIVSWLKRVTSPDHRYFRGILKRLDQFGGTTILERLRAEAIMTPESEAMIQIELAQALLAEGKPQEAAAAATEAVKKSPATAVAVECLTLGADRTEVAKRSQSLDGAGAGLDDQHYHPEASGLRTWVEGVTIAAATDLSSLATAEAKIKGEGWYKNWLRFVISLARAEEQSIAEEAGAEARILDAFRNLASDTAPFKGKPRACDLYSVKAIIHDTFARALRLILTPANFEIALTHLAEVSLHTTTYLQNSPGGPLIPEKFIEILMPFIVIDDFKAAALGEMTRQQARVRRGDELYDTLAIADLLLARALAIGGDLSGAERLWQSASVHLCAYGYRREISIFDLTESAAALGKADAPRAAQLIAATQPLVNAVDSHTDGKETQYAPIYWASALGQVDSVAGAYVLARSMVRHGGAVDWRYENGFEEIVDAARERGAPSLIGFLDATIPKAGDGKDLEKKLATIQRLIDENAELGTLLLRVLAAKVKGGDSKGLVEKALLAATGREANTPADPPVEAVESDGRNEAVLSSVPDRLVSFIERPIFDAGASPLDLLVAIRSGQRSDSVKDPNQQQLINAFGYRLVEMIERGQEDEAIRLLTSLARETHFWESATLLAEIGEGLERHVHTRAAAVAFALAYARSRGGRGYLFLGDEKELPWLVKACVLSQDDALHTLADEVSHLLNHQGYYHGITRHLVEALAALSETRETAFDAWQSAYDVIRHRLPRNEDDYYIYEKYEPATVPELSVDEALVFLLLARQCHPELGRKTSAVVGLLHLVTNNPATVIKPLRCFLGTDAPISSALLVLQALLLAEESPFSITASLQEELRALHRCGLFGLRVMAEILLERAGLDLGPPRQPPIFTEKPVPARKREAILSLDWGDRVSNIAMMWAEFPLILAGMFHERWENSKTLRDRSNSRHEAARSRVYESLPWTKMLFWEMEIFEMLFHEVLEGIDAELWRSGAWDPDIIPWLLQKTLPRLPIHAGRWYSRINRPDLPLPSEAATGVTPALPFSTTCEFNGWYRCGYYERELVLRSTFRVDDEVRVTSAIHLPDSAKEIRPSDGPLAKGRADVWMDAVERRHRNDLTIRPVLPGPTIGLDFVQDWLGAFPILMLQPYLQVRHGLTPNRSSPNRLELVDGDGKVAAVFRHWEEQTIGDSSGEEVPRLRGCDLLVRPDVFDRMARGCARPPVTVTLRYVSEELPLEVAKR